MAHAHRLLADLLSGQGMLLVVVRQRGHASGSHPIVAYRLWVTLLLLRLLWLIAMWGKLLSARRIGQYWDRSAFLHSLTDLCVLLVHRDVR